MRVASPDALRPNSDLVARAKQNFNRRPRHPSPSQLPIPSLWLRTSEQAPSQLLRQPSSKTVIGTNRRRIKSAPHRMQVVKGKNRIWRVKPKSPSPKTQVVKGKNRIWTVRRRTKSAPSRAQVVKGKNRIWTVRYVDEGKGKTKGKRKRKYNKSKLKIHKP
tara:strand:+ start:198 stop:680 length:483 start_codon:yes stop_codon:yes gene_type:complete